MKTTTVRKLLPETWGFLCPWAACGLLSVPGLSGSEMGQRSVPGASSAESESPVCGDKAVRSRAHARWLAVRAAESPRKLLQAGGGTLRGGRCRGSSTRPGCDGR